MDEPQLATANNDELIVSHLEIQRKALAENSQVVDSKAWWVFLITNTASAAIVTGHVYVIQRGNHNFAIGFVLFFFLYLGMLKLFGDIINPAAYVGGPIDSSDEVIRQWRSLPAGKTSPQLIVQYQAVCEDMKKRLDHKADKLELCLRVFRILLVLVVVEASIYIWLGAP